MQVAHVSPFFDDDTVRPHGMMAPEAGLARLLLQSFLVFAGIGAQKRGEIGIGQSIPGDAEYDAGWRNVFPNRGRIGGELLNRVAIVDAGGTVHSREGLSIRRNRIDGFTEPGLGLLGGRKDSRGKAEAEKQGIEFSFHGAGILGRLLTPRPAKEKRFSYHYP